MNNNLTDRWIRHLLDMAKLVASMSKDPSTKVGAVIVRPNRTVVSTGFNGYPRGVDDSDYHNRERKYQRIIHAEMNAILTAAESVQGCTLFVWPIAPCDRCMPHIIQAGITQVVFPFEAVTHHWSDSCRIACGMASEVGIKLVDYKYAS